MTTPGSNDRGESGNASNPTVSGASQDSRIDFYRVPKIPNFFQQDPALWFIQVESTLANARITNQKTMADAVIAVLDFNVIVNIKDLISAQPPHEDLYTRIKSRLIATYAASSESRLRQLLKGEVLSDGKPSQILNRLHSLNVSNCNDDIIKSIFLEQLPSQYKAILAMANVSSLQALAELADKIVEASSASETPVATVSRGSSLNTDLSTKVDQLATQLSDLTVQLRQLTRSRSRGSSRSTSNSRKKRDRSIDNSSLTLCRLHRKYGNAARHCIKPCTWKPNAKPEN